MAVSAELDERAAIPAPETPPLPVEEPTGLHRTFAAVREYPQFRRLWAASLGASLGQWMQSTALGWLAFDLTGSKSFVGLVVFMSGLPFLIISIPGGVLIDRFDRRRVLMICQGLAATLAVIVSIDVISGSVVSWHLLIAGFLNGSLQAILTPSQQSLVPRMVPRASLTNAIGLMSAGSSMTRVFGPSLAGAIIGFVGNGEAFLLQAAALIAAFYLMWTTKIERPTSKLTTTGMKGALDGLKLVGSRDDLRGLFLIAAIPSFFIFPYISFLSVYAKEILKIGPEGLGLLLASSGCGAVVGGLLIASRVRHDGIGRKMILGTFAYSATIAAFALSPSVYASVPILVLAGVLGAFFMGSNNAAIQHRISDDVRGRVMGTYNLTAGLMPLGALPLGIAADAIGTQTATVLGTVTCATLVAILVYRNRTIATL